MEGMKVEMMETLKQDHFVLKINDLVVGEFEKSQYRHLMEKIDNAI